MDLNAPQRKFLPHDVPLSIRADDTVFFLTICAEPRGENQLCHGELAPRLFAAVAFYNGCGKWWTHFALLMSDHLHMLVSFPDVVGRARTAVSEKPPYRGKVGRSPTMAGAVADWKRYTAGEFGVRWQRDFFDRRLRGEEGFRDKEEYIRQNPVRAGLVTDASEWPYVWWPEKR